MSLSKRIGAIIIITTMAFSLLCGCSGNVSRGTDISGRNRLETKELSGSLNITGSTSMQEVCDALGEGFTEKYKKVKFAKGGTGSGEAVKAVTDGVSQIGDLSRDLKSNEDSGSFDVNTIALDGIVVVTNKSKKMSDFSKDQVAKIYSGQISNWSELGEDSAPVTVVGRDAASGTREGFESLFGVSGKCKYAVELNSTGEVRSKVASDPNAIGYISIGSIDSSINAVSIDGAKPTEENVKNETYKVARPFVQICKKESSDDLVNAWFDFVYSEEGNKIISSLKLIPTPKK